MVFTFCVFFVLPWIIAVLHLNPKDRKIIPLIGPISSTVPFVINEVWFYFDFGDVYPFTDQKTLAALPFNLGLYPVLGCYLIFLIKKNKHPYLYIFLVSLGTTLLELLFLSEGGLVYKNGWNIFWTGAAYFASFFFGYLFYLYLKKLKIIT